MRVVFAVKADQTPAEFLDAPQITTVAPAALAPNDTFTVVDFPIAGSLVAVEHGPEVVMPRAEAAVPLVPTTGTGTPMSVDGATGMVTCALDPSATAWMVATPGVVARKLPAASIVPPLAVHVAAPGGTVTAFIAASQPTTENAVVEPTVTLASVGRMASPASGPVGAVLTTARAFETMR